MKLLKGLIALSVLTLVGADSAFAQVEGAAAGGDWAKVAAGFGIALAAFGGAMGQGKVAAAALEGVARNPGAAGQMNQFFFLGLVFVESLVIFALVIALKLAAFF